MKPRPPANPHEQQKRLFAEWFDLRPSKARRACPRIVAGKRCLSTVVGERCICTRHREPLDHPRLWRTSDGHHIFTAEPYEVDFDDLAPLAAELKDLGLNIRLSGLSPWYPGRTFLIFISRDSWSSQGRFMAFNRRDVYGGAD